MVMVTARRSVLGAVIALVVLLGLPHAAQALTWKGCSDFEGVVCSSMTVPLDRAGVDPGTVPLRLARVGRTSGSTLLYLSGGPGGAGVAEMLGVVSALDFLQSRYRIIGYDQRGTGRSGLLRCPALERDPHLRSTTAAEQCAQTLGPARHHYTTADSVQDIEALRMALGVDKLTLFGISYGTELALAYARTYPKNVARLIIDSVVDPDDRDPFVGASFRAMGPTLRALCPGRCTGISKDPVGDLAELVARVRATPMKGIAYDALGAPHSLQIGPTALLDLMFAADYSPALRAAIPAAVKSALAGDGAPLARLLREGRTFDDLGSPRDFSAGRFATICEETPLPWDPETPIEQRPAIAQERIAAAGANAFRPFDPGVVAEDEIDLCLRWPEVPRPPTPPPPPYPQIPTLILQGSEDLRTPPEGSARVAKRIPGAKRLVVPGVGHAVVAADPSDCGANAVRQFIGGQRVQASCRRVGTGVPAVLYAPRSFEALPGMRGLPVQVGRTVRALAATFDDLRIVNSPAFGSRTSGGLRGGTSSADGLRLRVRNYQAVPGVSITGSGGSALTLRVSGSKAAAGTVTLRSGGRLTGTLGGRSISLRLGSPSSPARLTGRASALSD